MADAQGCTEQITVRLEEAGAIDAIEILQEHENNDVYNAAFAIINTWFKGEIQFSFSRPLKLNQHSVDWFSIWMEFQLNRLHCESIHCENTK